jgi:hypothetical protein
MSVPTTVLLVKFIYLLTLTSTNDFCKPTVLFFPLDIGYSLFDIGYSIFQTNVPEGAACLQNAHLKVWAKMFKVNSLHLLSVFLSLKSLGKPSEEKRIFLPNSFRFLNTLCLCSSSSLTFEYQ